MSKALPLPIGGFWLAGGCSGSGCARERLHLASKLSLSRTRLVPHWRNADEPWASWPLHVEAVSCGRKAVAAIELVVAKLQGE